MKQFMKQSSQTGLHISDTTKIQAVSARYGREKLLFLRAVCFFVILWGTLLMMGEGFGLNLRLGLLLLVIGVVCCLKILWYAFDRYTGWELPIGGGLWVLAVLFGHRYFYSSYLMVENACRAQINAYYELAFDAREVPIETVGSDLFIGLLLLLLMLFLGKLVIVHGRITLLALIELLLFSLEMVCGCHFLSYGLYLVLGGFFVLWAMGMSRSGRLSGPTVRTGCWVLVILLVLGMICSQILGPLLYNRSEPLHEWLTQAVVRLENQLSLLVHEEELPGDKISVEDGGLTNDPLEQNGEIDLVVTVSDLPESNLYLKGFVGGTYEKTYWDNVDEEDFKNAFPQPEAASEIQNILYRYVGANSLLNEGVATVSRMESAGRYGYVPYGFSVGVTELEQTDGSWLSQEDTAVYSGYANWRKFVSNGAAQEAESEWEAAYSAYVPEEYLKVPVYGLDQLKEYCAGQNLSTVQEVIDFVVADVRGHGTYSQDLEPVPEGEDFIEYFYFTQQKGYCIHYASMATMMLRLMGVPARYVTGYVIPSQSFAATESGYTAEVPDTQAHAWVEVYRSGKGWIPLEVTPGFDAAINESGQEAVLPTPTPTPQTEEPEETQPEITQEPEPTEEQGTLEELDGMEEQGSLEDEDSAKEQGAPEEPAVSEEPDFEETQGEDIQEVSEKDHGKLVLLLVMILLAAAGVGIWLYWKKEAARKRKRQFLQKDCNQAIVAISREIFSLLETAGYTVGTQAADASCAAELEAQAEVFEKGELQKLVSIAQEAAFGSRKMSPKERADCLRLLERLETWLSGQKGENRKKVLKP